MLTFYAGFLFPFINMNWNVKMFLNSILKWRQQKCFIFNQVSSLSCHVDYFVWTVSAILSMYDTNLRKIIKNSVFWHKFQLDFIVHLFNYFCISSITFLQDMLQNLFNLCIYGTCSSNFLIRCTCTSLKTKIIFHFMDIWITTLHWYEE